MLKIYSNYNKQDVSYSFSIGQAFPDVKGKLLRIEINGKELSKLLEVWEVPFEVENNSLTWHGKHAGRVMKMLKEIF